MNIITSNSNQTLLSLTSKYVFGIDFKQLLDTQDPITKVTNWDKIQRKYSVAEAEDNLLLYQQQDYDNILVKKGTPILLLLPHIKRDLAKSVDKEIFQLTNFKALLAEQLNELLRDPKYSQQIDNIGNVANNDITVYVWCRALSTPGSTSQEGTWFNLSAFVKNVQIQVGAQLGNFTLQLSPVMCEYDLLNGWKLSQVSGYDTGSLRDDIVSQASLIHYNKEGEGLSTTLLFNTILQDNDLIYIRFERLDVDQELETRLRQVNGSLSQNDIANRTYDMIGLVDNVTISGSPNDAITSVVGRDLMKILIEDGSYFFPEQFAQNIFTDENSILTKRNRIELQSQALAGASYTFKSIETILKFIFNKFSNIGLVPNSALNGYGKRVAKDKYELRSSNLAQTKAQEVIDQINDIFLKEERQGIWRICELVFDPQIANRVLADNSISQDSGSIINSIRKICQEPLVEFYGDTYKDKYWFIIRKPPFDKKGYVGLVYDDSISEQNKANTKVQGDDKVSEQRVQQAQSDRQATTRPSALSDLVIDIDITQVDQCQLGYHNEVYSWYRVIPRGLGIMDEATSFLLAPIIPFDEYAEIWGNKTYSLEYNYAPTEYLQDSQFSAEAKYAEAQTFYDLQFIIQSHQYLPFTRKGSIKLIGNRLIKRGLFIYYKPTDEVFYVDSVSHTRTDNGNRSTTLTVSRGMRREYIKGKFIEFGDTSKRVSYFSIINTAIENDASINNKEFLKNWRVDRDIFNFFVQRRQWVD